MGNGNGYCLYALGPACGARVHLRAQRAWRVFSWGSTVMSCAAAADAVPIVHDEEIGRHGISSTHHTDLAWLLYALAEMFDVREEHTTHEMSCFRVEYHTVPFGLRLLVVLCFVFQAFPSCT